MRAKNFLQTRVSLYSKSRDFCLGKGVKTHTDKVCDAMILFLADEFEKNPNCLLGDTRGLLVRKKEIDQQRLGEKIYREHLQEMIQKGVYSLPKENR